MQIKYVINYYVPQELYQDQDLKTVGLTYPCQKK